MINAMTDPVSRVPDPDFRKKLLEIREMMGSWKQSEYLQQTVQGFRTQKGIYKPGGSEYALWIRQTLKGIYPDVEEPPLPDGSWTYLYTPESKEGRADLSLDTNRALIRSMEDQIPVGVFIERNLPGEKTTYEVMGLAYIDRFDGTHFVLRGLPIDFQSPPMKDPSSSRFQPFENDPLPVTNATIEIRNKGFMTAVRRAYRGRCSLCELGYTFRGEPIGLEAAHIIPVSAHGTSKDVRNGILLCKNHHDLFDRFLWAFDEDYRVVVSDDREFRKSAEKNHVMKAEGRRLSNLPGVQYDLPASEAVRFRLERFHSASDRSDVT